MTRYLGGRHSYKVEVLPLSHPLAILPRISICPTQSDAYNTTRLRVSNLIVNCFSDLGLLLHGFFHKGTEHDEEKLHSRKFLRQFNRYNSC